MSLLMVARAARVAIRTIYVKFGGKPGLLDAVIEAEGRRHRGELDALELEALDARAPGSAGASHGRTLRAAGAGHAMAVLRTVLTQAGEEGHPDSMPGLPVEQGLSLFLCAVMRGDQATGAKAR